MSNYEIELQVQGSPSGELTQQVDGEPGGGSVSAREAEAWARGTRAGTAVSSDDPTYHNNSKYYAEQAHDAAESASAAYGTNLLAPTFDASQAYPAGAHVIHDGGYYVLPEGHTAGDTWAETSKTQQTVGGEVTGLKSAIQLKPVETLNNVAIYTSGNYYVNLNETTGYEVQVFEIDKYSEVIVKRPESSNVVFGVSNTLFTEEDIPVQNTVFRVQDSHKEYTYNNPYHYKYLYLMTKTTTASYKASVSIHIPTEISRTNKELSDLKTDYEETEEQVSDNTEAINNILIAKPLYVINNADISFVTTDGKIVSSSGGKVAVYELNNRYEYIVKRPNSSDVTFLISDYLYSASNVPTSWITGKKSNGTEYRYKPTKKYMYITVERENTPSYYAEVELDINSVIKASEEAYEITPKEEYLKSIPSNIVCTYKNMYVMNDNGILKFSNDNMKTWENELDVSSYGLIKTYHLFANGCIAFYTHQKAYYSEDWETINEASVYESDGETPYVPSTYDNFMVSRDHADRKYVGDQDLYVFGNYGITDESNTRRNIYATFDNGHTYKVLYEFNIAGAESIRHIHSVVYNPNFDKFLCLTGDSNSESHVISFTLTDESISDFTVLGTGHAYKWAGSVWWGEYVYYCLDQTPGAVLKCKFTEIGDLTKHTVILDNLPNDSIGLFIGDRGDMLVTLSSYRSGDSNSPISAGIDCLNIYYSKDREHFERIHTENVTTAGSMIYYGFYGTNSDGRIISGCLPSNVALANWGKMPSVDLADIVKRAGFSNAFKPYNPAYDLVPVLSMYCADQTVVEDQTIDFPSIAFYPYNASVKEYEITEYDHDIIHLENSGTTILGWQPGVTTVKIRAKNDWNVIFEFNVTVTPKET